MLNSILHLSINQKRTLVFAHDALVGLISFPLAMGLRLSTFNLAELGVYPLTAPVILVFIIKLTVFSMFKLSRGIWKFSSIPDLKLILKCVTASVLLSFIVLFFWNRLEDVPRSVFLIDGFILAGFLGGDRFLYRIWKEDRYSASEARRIFVIGAGEAGENLIRELLREYPPTYEVVGIFDDNKLRHGRTIHGIPVLGFPEDVPRFASERSVNEAVVAIPSAKATEIRRIVDLCLRAKLSVKTLPASMEILKGNIQVSQLRPVNLDDLLGRGAIQLDIKGLGEMLSGKSVLVTGAGGSIGQELCRQIAQFAPKQLVLFETCEFFLYKVDMQLREMFPELEVIPFIGDIRDRLRVQEALETYRPQILFHGAAYKHVPMMEANPREAVKTNCLGTRILAEEAVNFGVHRFVMISTDKAVNPTNIMGATKRVAEMICQYEYERHLKNDSRRVTKFIVVRFGNVLGSAGSVIPLFMDQIKRGGPITVTHPEVTRYFMSIPEATQLVLQSANLGNANEIFVLEMGNPIKIVDLARDLIQLSGYQAEDIAIEYTGLRPGEKLYEELLADEEQTLPTNHAMIRVSQTRSLPSEFLQYLKVIFDGLSHERKSTEITELIKLLVPEYTAPMTSPWKETTL